MALIICPECSKEISDQAKVCPHCGYKLPKQKKKKEKKEVSPRQKKKRIAVIVGVLVLLVALGLVYFFFSPRTVEWCCYHNVQEATCTESQICSRCGKTWGDPVGHDWKEATCTEPKACTVCGEIEGSENGHDWEEATCTEPKTCTVCGETEGSATGHSWKSATCTTAKICRNCNTIEGKKLGHNIVDYVCTRCDETKIFGKDVPNVLDITSMQYEVNSVGGIDIYMTFQNKSSTKIINYISVKMEFYNAVRDVLHDDITNKTSATLQFTGPLNPGETSTKAYWRACFYNSTFSGSINMKEITIKYSDGTTLVLKEGVAEQAVVNWR